jgi:hypothetical protein
MTAAMVASASKTARTGKSPRLRQIMSSPFCKNISVFFEGKSSA